MNITTITMLPVNKTFEFKESFDNLEVLRTMSILARDVPVWNLILTCADAIRATYARKHLFLDIDDPLFTVLTNLFISKFYMSIGLTPFYPNIEVDIYFPNTAVSFDASKGSLYLTEGNGSDLSAVEYASCLIIITVERSRQLMCMLKYCNDNKFQLEYSVSNDIKLSRKEQKQLLTINLKHIERD